MTLILISEGYAWAETALTTALNFWSRISWFYDGVQHSSELTGVLIADDISGVLEANGYAPSVESDQAVFVTEVRWPGSPAFFSNDHLDGRIDMKVADGRFLRDSDSGGALRLVSFINLSAIFQRLRLVMICCAADWHLTKLPGNSILMMACCKLWTAWLSRDQAVSIRLSEKWTWLRR